MKIKSYIFGLLLLFKMSSTYSQEVFYYGDNGEKYFLEQFNLQSYVLLNTPNVERVAEELKISLSDFDLVSESKMDNFISPFYSPENLGGEFFWSFINTQIDFNATSLVSDIEYIAPSFISNGEIIGLSQFIHVKLKDEKDINTLLELSGEYCILNLNQI